MLRRWLLSLLCLLIMSMPLAAQDSAANRGILSISVLPPLDPMPTEETFVPLFIQTVQTSVDAGVTGSLVAETWSALEPTSGQFKLDEINGLLFFLTGTHNQTLLLGIQVINTTVKETPDDLLDVPFDSPQMIRRFQDLIDALAPSLDEHVRYISIGNEVDAYLSAHPDEWEAYTRFYEAAAAYVRLVLPHVQVGVTVTFGGAQADPDEVARLTAHSDIFVMTYYPLNPDFTVRSPDAPLADVPLMIEMAGGKPLLLQEVGYPAAESLGSSDEAQAAFIHHVFEAWDDAEGQIVFLNIFAMGDFSAQMCDDFLTYYNLPNVQTFYDYLCTLGLRRADGTPRLAWDAFVDEAQDR